MSAGELHAAFADLGLILIGEPHDLVVNVRADCRLYDLFVCGVQTTVTDVLKDRSGKQENVLLHDADVAAQRFLRVIADVNVVDQDRALHDVVEPHQQMAHRGLAAAGRTDERELFTRFDREVDMIEDLTAAFIMKADVTELDFALYVLHLDRVFTVDNVAFCVQNLKKPRETRHAHHVLLKEARKALQRRCKRRYVEHEGNECQGTETGFFDDQDASCEEHDHVEQSNEKLRAAVEDRHCLIKAVLGVQERVVAFLEFFDLILLVCKCLCDARAGDGGFDARIDVRDLFLDRLACRFHRKPRFHHKEDAERHEKQHGKRNAPFNKEHGDKRAEHGERRDQKVLGSMVRKLGNLKQVGRRAGKKLPGADLVIEAERQRLYM